MSTFMPYLAGTLWSGATSNSSTQGRAIKSTKVSFLTVLELRFHRRNFPQGLRTFGGSQCLLHRRDQGRNFQGHYIIPQKKSAKHSKHFSTVTILCSDSSSWSKRCMIDELILTSGPICCIVGSVNVATK